MPIRLLLADDHPAFRAGLRAYLDAEPDLEIVAEADSGERALVLAREHHPDVLLLDMEMPGLDGLDVTRTLAQEDLPTAVLILSGYEDEGYIFGVLDAGAAGYLSKQEPLGLIADAVRGVAAGDMGWLSRQISALYVRRHREDRIAATRQSEAQRTFASLSEREREVLELVAEGLDNGAIADKLFVSESTVKKHVHGVYGKTGLGTRAQVVAWAWRYGFVDEQDGAIRS